MGRFLLAGVLVAIAAVAACSDEAAKAPKWGAPPPEKRRAPDNAPPDPYDNPPPDQGKPAEPPAPPPKPPADVDPVFVLKHTMSDIDGAPIDLSSFKGKVVMVVNVASKCGLTPQYEALQALYESKKDAGLVVLGVPANNFGSQEPGTDAEIKEFCTGKYHVTFPMLAKISVKGDDRHPLYAQLASLPEPLGGEPKWNFTKFLVDRSGRVVARYEPRTTPADPALLAKVDELLAAK